MSLEVFGHAQALELGQGRRESGVTSASAASSASGPFAASLRPASMTASVSSAVNSTPDGTVFRRPLFSGQTSWQSMHPMRQTALFGGRVPSGIGRRLSEKSVKHRSAEMRKRSSRIAPVGQALMHARQLAQRSSAASRHLRPSRAV